MTLKFVIFGCTLCCQNTFIEYNSRSSKLDVTKKVEFLTESQYLSARGGSRTAAISKMERFVIIVNGWKP